MINPRALKLFHLVANTGSLAAASEQFNLSPPAASRLLSILESELDLELFSREGRHLSLTTQGERFVRESQPILINFESIERIAQDIRADSATALRVLSTAPVAVSWITPALTQLRAQHPGFACAVEVVDHLGMQSLVGSRSHDIAVASLPLGHNSSRLSEHPLCAARFEAVMHRDHPCAKKSHLSAKDLAEHTLISLYQGQIGRTRQDEFLHSQQVEISPQFETSSSVVAMALCRQKFGIALMPAVYLLHDLQPDLISVPIKPERWIQFGAATPEGQKLSSVQQDFLTLLKQYALGNTGIEESENIEIK